MVLLVALLEPFIPSFSAKAYSQLNLKRDEKQDKIYAFLKEDPKNRFWNLVTDGHIISQPQPIFKRIEEAEAEAFKEKFGGKRDK